jgi:DNA-binding transcriptional regulator LsrR (DeoR family)
MTALEILSDLRRAGAIVTVAGDKLRFEAPPGVLTDELKQRLATQKAEIIRLLQAETRPGEVFLLRELRNHRA